MGNVDCRVLFEKLKHIWKAIHAVLHLYFMPDWTSLYVVRSKLQDGWNRFDLLNIINISKT